MKEKNNAENNETIRTAPVYLNRVTIAGFIGDTPEAKNGCTIFSVATKRFWKKNEEWESETEWHRVIAWGQLGEAIKTFTKGEHVLVEGELRSHDYEKPVKAGRSTTAVKIRVWEIRAESIRQLAKPVSA